LFKPEVVQRLLKEHDSGAADHRKEIWTLLILQLWLRHHNCSII
jgi:asparagine synthase (glutamine-hydrolysing)